MKKMIFIDFETFYDTKAGYGLKTLSVLEYVRDPRFKVHGMGVAFESDRAPVWIPAKDILDFFLAYDLQDYAVVAHNAKFDGFIATEYYKEKAGQWIDTLGMANAVIGKLSAGGSLATLARYYGLPEKGVMKTDGLRDLTPEQEKELAEYCLHDVWLTREIFRRMEPQFPAGEYDQLDWTVRTFVEPKLVLNQKVLEEVVKDEQKRKEGLLRRAQKDRAIFSSNPKFAALLQEKGYEVPTKKSPRTGKDIPALALGDEAFSDMLHSENQELRELCETRAAIKSTLLETRAAKLAKIAPTGPWAFDVVYSGAKQTHRLSGGSGSGGNPQNFTRGSALRRAVEAPQGYKLIVGDFSMIECRLVAHLANDPALIEALEGDPYCDFASMFFGRKITKADDAERRFGKEAILGLGYGMGPKKFRVRVKLKTGQNLSEEDARRAVDLYRNRYVYVTDLWKCLDNAISYMEKGLSIPSHGGTVRFTMNSTEFPVRLQEEGVRLPSGLIIKFPNLRKVYTERGYQWIYTIWGKSKAAPETAKLYGGKLLENISQALARELCKEAAEKVGLQNVTGTVHDEIHCLTDDRVMLTSYPAHIPSEYMAKVLKQAMETPPIWMPNLKLKSEIGIGRNWLEAK